MKDFYLLLALWALGTNPAFPQEGYSYHGRLLAAGQPLGQVNIRAGSRLGVSSPEGYFSLRLDSPSASFLFTRMGYAPLELQLNAGADTLSLEMALLSVELDEVLVSTGYEQLPKERATGSFESIGPGVLGRRVSTDVISRLEGVSGIYFDRRTGGSALSIRGRSTILADASPLTVVDGFPYDGDINNLNPNDIEKITVLKDASAASIWGVRAANGVIVITTRQGEKNRKPLLEITTNLTLGAEPDLYYAPFMAAADFIEVESFLFGQGFYNSTLENQAKPVVTPVVELLALQAEGQLSRAWAAGRIRDLKAKDVRKDLEQYFYRPSLNRQYALSYSGGAATYHYLLSAGWDNNLSSLIRNDMQRFTLRSENTLKPTKKLSLRLGLNYAQISNQNNNPGSTGIFPSSKSLYPYAELADAEGNPLAIPKDYRLGYLDGLSESGLLDWHYRPLQELQLSDRSSTQHDVRIRGSVSYAFSPVLNLELSYQRELQQGQGRNYSGADSYLARNLINQFSTVKQGLVQYGLPVGGILDGSHSAMLSRLARSQLNYTHKWKAVHRITALAGAEIRDRSFRSQSQRLYGYRDDLLTYQNVNLRDMLPTWQNLRADQRIPDGVSLADRTLRFTSLFANVGYGLDERYLLSVSARKDASNLFGLAANKRGVPLWSAGLGWQVDKEDFYGAHLPPELKLRLTYGYSGNVDNTLSALPTLAYYSNAYQTGQQYAVLRNPGNPQLRWEKSGMLNLGLDFATAGPVLRGSFDFYLRKGRDLIAQAPVDPTTGVTAPSGSFAFKGNVADMKGSGLDVVLHSDPLKGALEWQSDLIVNLTANRLTRYRLPAATANAYTGFGNLVTPFEGNPVYGIYSFAWAGLEASTGNPQGYLDGEVSQDYAAILFDNPRTLHFHGSAVPVLFGSLRNTFSFRDLSLSFNLIYKGGYYFRRSGLSYYNLFSLWQGHPDYADRWQKPGDEARTDVPSMAYPNSSLRDLFYTGSGALVERGDHIRFQDINLSYSPPRRRQGPLRSIQLYTYLNNLGIIYRANRSGLDPDFYNGGFPLPFTVSLGLKASF
ncbi:SusC/RagA family TonB-linked outer membrane protein [Marinilongibacter aquaticus]|uniref:SusC/RagA family TonB-linked outer membrane protein n=1 Tax=Marinilongibacter aquaticus TaxID=2975157 RepID=UPI0021BDD710|nr:SusC/RagA family TonB-linked outer membrane protein [Marinilongibacter aquaticus]UBM60036.1 SusC/RagA family TonB-linked outer membrane protein [Marinilongibacter aquaticus]UBM60796.1 SusC/RagA family TonB-linked outer membrane protein [Marinilongibacter aquaticus]